MGVGSILVIREVDGAVKHIAGACFQQIPGAIARDAIEPGIERALAAKMLQSSIGPNKRLLGSIFRIGAIARIAHCKLYYSRPVLEYQPVEGPAFTGLGTLHEALIADISARREIVRVSTAHTCGSELGVGADGFSITKE
jgi:hypothetical protein